VSLLATGCLGADPGDIEDGVGLGGAGGNNGAPRMPADPVDLGDFTAPDGGVDNTPEDPSAQSCAAKTEEARAFPLDLVAMVDTSGSMLQVTTPGNTKWSSIKSAFSSFFRSSESGVSVGLHFFPQYRPGVPRTCFRSADCGFSGPCLFPRFCQFQNCDGVPGYCGQRDLCEVADYRDAVVGVSALPDAAAALESALEARTPIGSTPTGPALEAAIEEARLRAAGANRRAAVVLATDGLPTRCSNQRINEVAALARAGSQGNPPVTTFVIGVFSEQEARTARSNLNTIARAGGSNEAFIVSTNGDVDTDFLRALEEIRTAALPCDYSLPPAESGEIDFDKVNVQLSRPQQPALTLPRVENLAACGTSDDPLEAGWYYNVNPGSTSQPTQISACPATCTALKAEARGRVELVFGCKTRVAL